MGRCINTVTLLGNLGSDPDTIRGGAAFSVATSERWTDDAGQTQERTDWHRVVVFGKRAPRLAEILRKGARVAVVGTLRSSSYTDKDGAKRWSVDVIAADVVLLDPPPAGTRDKHERGPRQRDADDMPGEG